MSTSNAYETSTSIAAVIIAAATGFAIAFWVWPWLGPQLFSPCPMWTGLGVGVYTAYSALKGVGQLMREARLKRIEAQLKDHEKLNDFTRDGLRAVLRAVSK